MRGELATAIRRYRAVVARLPLPEYVIALGDIELASGRAAAARRDYALVGVEQPGQVGDPGAVARAAAGGPKRRSNAAKNATVTPSASAMAMRASSDGAR